MCLLLFKEECTSTSQKPKSEDEYDDMTPVISARAQIIINCNLPAAAQIFAPEIWYCQLLEKKEKGAVKYSFFLILLCKTILCIESFGKYCEKYFWKQFSLVCFSLLQVQQPVFFSLLEVINIKWRNWSAKNERSNLQFVCIKNIVKRLLLEHGTKTGDKFETFDAVAIFLFHPWMSMWGSND